MICLPALSQENKKFSPQDELKYIYQLKNKDAKVRRNALEQLGIMHSKKAVPYIINILNDPDTNVKMLAISILGTSKDNRAYQPLLNIFNDKSKSLEIRDRAGLSLAFLGNKNATAHMLKALETETDNIFKAHIIDNLGYLKDKTAASKIIPFLKDNNWQIRYFTCGTLGSLKCNDAVLPLIEAFKIEEIDDIKQQIIYSFGLIGDNRAVLLLIEQLKSKNYQFRRYAIFSLGCMKDSSVVPYIIKMLNDKHYIVRSMAAGTLQSLNDKRAVDPLIKALKNEKEPTVRCSIVRALAVFWDKKIIDTLINTFNKEADIAVKIDIANTLSFFNDEKSINALLNIAKNTNENCDIRYTAIESLGILKAKEALPLIQSYAEEPTDALMRAVCAWAMGEFKDKSSLAILNKLLKDENESVRKEAKKAIEKINKNN